MPNANLNISSLGPTPFSTVPWNTHPSAADLHAREPARPMSYVMSFPSVVQDASVEPDEILPGRHPSNFFAQLDEEAQPRPLPAPSDYACQPDHRPPRGLRGRRALRPGAKAPLAGAHSTLPRDTLLPLLSQMQAEENAKAAFFHPEVGYLSNTRGDGPPCRAQLYSRGGIANRPNAELENGADGDMGSDGEGVGGGTHHHQNTKRHNKRGDLSTATGRRFFTDGCFHEPDHYASCVAEVANTQPTTTLGIVAKALANAIHNPSNEPRRTPIHKTTAFRNLSGGLQDILMQRNREGRFKVGEYLETTNALVLPPPLTPDRGVDVDHVYIPHDPFMRRKIYAPHDGPDPIDQVGVEPPNVAAVCGPDSILNVWNIVVKRLAHGPHDAEAAASFTNNSANLAAVNGSGSLVQQRVLTPHMISLFTCVSSTPDVGALANKGIRQGVSQRQPTAPSKSSFSDHGVLPTTQFTDVDLVPPNCVGFDSERFSGILSRYGDQLEEVLLDGATWLSTPSLCLIGRFCPNLRVLNISSCPQVDDACVAAITAGCPSLALVNISCCKGITSASIDSILYNTSNLIALSCSGLEQIDDTSAVAWSNLHRHRTLQFLDFSFCLRLPDAALVQVALFCSELEMLDLTGCTSLTDLALCSIGGSCRRLSVLRLRMCMMFSIKALETFAAASIRLTEIDFTGCQDLTSQTLDGFLARCTAIAHLNLGSCNKVDDGTLVVLQQRAQKLEILNLSGCSAVSSDGLMRLIHMIKSLTKIDLSGTRTSKTELFLLASVRESCQIVKVATEAKAKRRLHAFLAVEPKKPVPKGGAIKGRK